MFENKGSNGFLGIEYARGEYLLFLNNDTGITETLITGLKRQLGADPRIGLISPLILFYDNKQCIQYAGSGPINYFTGRNKGRDYQVTEETAYCHGAAMMCRRADLAAGLMEEHYFMYYIYI